MEDGGRVAVVQPKVGDDGKGPVVPIVAGLGRNGVEVDRVVKHHDAARRVLVPPLVVVVPVIIGGADAIIQPHVVVVPIIAAVVGQI